MKKWLFQTAIFMNDFLMFFMGTCGEKFFMWLQHLIAKCNTDVFVGICFILSFVVFSFIKKRLGNYL